MSQESASVFLHRDMNAWVTSNTTAGKILEQSQSVVLNSCNNTSMFGSVASPGSMYNKLQECMVML